MKVCRKNQGQAVVELALVLPILLLILFGIFEFGRIFNADLVITNASREGARKAAVGGSDSEVASTVNSAIGLLDAASLVVTVTPSGSRTSGEQVSVQVDYSVDIIVPVISSIVPNPFPLSSKTVMRIE